MVKSAGVQRESDGVVVPIGAGHASVGKDPDFDHAGGGGERQGMTGTARSNNPGGQPRPGDAGACVEVRRELRLRARPGEVGELQPKLWAAAKQSSERRFHALYDRIYRGDVLVEAGARVRANRGAAGVDRVTLAAVEAYGVERMLGELPEDLRTRRCRPAPARRVDIPKPEGGRRALSISTVRDPVAQAAAKLVLEPIFEVEFWSVSYGFWPRRSATQAMERLRVGYIAGLTHVVEFDIGNFFGEIEHDRLLGLVGARVSDRRVLKLVRQWLDAGVMVEGSVEGAVAGTPQGGVISSLLADIYLHVLDPELSARGVGELVGYVDDGVVVCRSAAQAGAAWAAVGDILAGLGLELHPDKRGVVDLREGWEGLDFLGCHFRARMSGGLGERCWSVRYCLHRWPSQRAMKRLRTWMRDRTGRDRVGRDIREVIAELNPVVRGGATTSARGTPRPSSARPRTMWSVGFVA